jgi:hypothetical protein
MRSSYNSLHVVRDVDLFIELVGCQAFVFSLAAGSNFAYENSLAAAQQLISTENFIKLEDSEEEYLTYCEGRRGCALTLQRLFSHFLLCL